MLHKVFFFGLQTKVGEIKKTFFKKRLINKIIYISKWCIYCTLTYAMLHRLEKSVNYLYSCVSDISFVNASPLLLIQIHVFQHRGLYLGLLFCFSKKMLVITFR